MKMFITCVVMCLIWVPYKMSDLSKDASFFQDFGIAAVGFALSGIIFKLTSGNKGGRPGNEGIG